MATEFGRLDILVNNAGLGPANLAEDVNEADFDLTFDVNVKGVYFASQAAGRVMIRQGHGRIIHLSSQAGFIALPTESVYCISKAAVAHLARCLAVEWGQHGITVNAVAPTFIRTDGTATGPRRPGLRGGGQGADRRSPPDRRAGRRGRSGRLPRLTGGVARHRDDAPRRRRLDGPLTTEPDGQFTTVFGRGLVEELPLILPRPYLVVTMADLWPRFKTSLAGSALAGVHIVDTLDLAELQAHRRRVCRLADRLSGWAAARPSTSRSSSRGRRGLPHLPGPDGDDGQRPVRSSVRAFGTEAMCATSAGRFPEAVYVDFDVIQSAPALLNRSGVGDILCYHTAHGDWRLARDLGREEARWPYDQRLVDEARLRLDDVLAHLDDIHEVNESRHPDADACPPLGRRHVP